MTETKLIAAPEQYYYVCPECFPNAITFGNVVAGNILCYATGNYKENNIKQGDYFLVTPDGEEVIWQSNIMPMPDPFVDIILNPEVDTDLFKKKSAAWVEIVDYVMWGKLKNTNDFCPAFKFDLRNAYEFVNEMIENGYDLDVDNSVEMWLYHKMGVLVKDNIYKLKKHFCQFCKKLFDESKYNHAVDGISPEAFETFLKNNKYNVSLFMDPYEYTINDKDTEFWICGKCYHNRVEMIK